MPLFYSCSFAAFEFSKIAVVYCVVRVYFNLKFNRKLSSICAFLFVKLLRIVLLSLFLKTELFCLKATFDPEIFFNIILPPIIFNAGYQMKRVC